MFGLLFKSLRVQLILMVLVVALPVFGIILYAGVERRQQAIHEAFKETASLAEAIADEQEHMVTGAHQLLRTLAQLTEIRAFDELKVQPLLADILHNNPQFLNIFVADPAGVMRVSGQPIKAPISVADRLYFTKAMETGRFSSGEYIVGRVNGQPTIAFAFPFKQDSGDIAGVIVVSFNLDGCRAVFNKAQLPNGTNYGLIDHRGIVVNRYIDPGQFIGTPDNPEIFRRMASGPDQGSFQGTGNDGFLRIFSTRKMRLAEEDQPYLYVRVGMPVESVLYNANLVLLKNLGLLCLFLLLSLFLTRIIGKKSIIDRVARLQEASRRLADGDLDTRVAAVVNGGELGSLARSFDEMARQLALREQQRREAETALRERETNYREIFNATNDALFIHDSCTGAIIEVNKAAEEMFGYRGDEFKFLTIDDVSLAQPPYSIEEAREWFRLAQSEGAQRFEWISVRKNGERFWTEVVLSSTTIGGAGRILAVVRDNNERKHALEEILREKEAAQRYLDIAGVMFTALDANGDITLINNKGCQILACTEEELLGKNWFDVCVAPAAQEESRAKFLAFIGGKPMTSQFDENIVVARDGSPRILALHMTLLRAPDGGVITGMLFSGDDITEQREAEEERKLLMEQLNQSRKLESIGRLAGGIAHDFNNLLTPIMGYADILKMRPSMGEKEREYVGLISQAAENARILVQQLLGFGRKQILDMQILDLNKVLLSFHDIIRRTIRESIDIDMRLSPNLYGIRADRNQLEQILMNLAINAQEAISDRGMILFETAPVDIDEEYARQHSGVVPGKYLMLAVTDNGQGMDKETLDNIFEPFFTTKGHGTGLGLANVYGLVKQHGGNIWVYSEPGKGTVFKIYFPIVEGVTAEERESVNGPHTPTVCSILLVEDNDLVRTMIEQVLEGYGYTVLSVEEPSQALKVMGTNHIDILLTDVVMPEMNGPELYEQIRKAHPHIKVLYMSGYTDDVIVLQGVLKQGVNFIQKPFAINDLLIKLDKSIKERDPL